MSAGCDRDEATPPAIDFAVQFDSGTVLLQTETDTLTLGVEVAETEQQRARGLMERETLAADSGMIFLFQQEQPPEEAFWMYRTLIPLSIAFIGSDGRIGSIVEMVPCEHDVYWQYCPNYAAGVPFQSALEVNRGYFPRHGISVGDRVILERE